MKKSNVTFFFYFCFFLSSSIPNTTFIYTRMYGSRKISGTVNGELLLLHDTFLLFLILFSRASRWAWIDDESKIQKMRKLSRDVLDGRILAPANSSMIAERGGVVQSIKDDSNITKKLETTMFTDVLPSRLSTISKPHFSRHLCLLFFFFWSNKRFTKSVRDNGRKYKMYVRACPRQASDYYLFFSSCIPKDSVDAISVSRVEITWGIPIFEVTNRLF